MKKFLILGAVVALVVSAQATLVIDSTLGNTWTVNQSIPDANPTGIALSQTFSGLYNGAGDAGINQVDVHLNITGGFNGDLYGYLVLQNGSGNYTSILLNRVGRNDASGLGSETAGFGSITLSSVGAWGNIHDETGNPNGNTYLADGRAMSPNGNFSGVLPTAQLDDLHGANVNGTWTLFLADMAGGDVSTLVSWGLDVSVVPEPATWALIIFGSLLGVGVVARRLRRRTA